MLGHTQAIIDRAVAAGGKQPRCAAQIFGLHPGHGREEFGRMALVRHEIGPIAKFVPVAAFAHEGFIDQALGHDDMRHRGQHRDIGARRQRQVVIGLDMGRSHDVGAARIDHDQPRALAQPLFHAAGEHRVAIGGVGADHHDHVAVFDAVKILRAGRSAERVLQAIAGGRMAHARAGIDIVGAKPCPHQLLHQEPFLVGAAAGNDAAQRVVAVLGGDALQFAGGVAQRLFPGHLAPGFVDAGADHRAGDAILMAGIAPGKAALDARMPAVGLALFPGHHAHHLFALHLGAERAADAAIGASRHHRAFGLADVLHRLFIQRGSGACRDTGPARHAFGRQEIVAGKARADLGIKPAPRNGEREGPLHFLAGAHAARTDDALRRIEIEIGVRLIGRLAQMVFAFVTIAHIAQAHAGRHVLQFAIVVGAAGQAIERVVGNVQLHHPAAQLVQPLGLGVDDHPFGDQRGARSGRAAHPVDLDEAQPARSELFQRVGGAKLGDRSARKRRRSHHRGARGHAYLAPVDADGNGGLAGNGRGSEIGLGFIAHGGIPVQRPDRPAC